MIHIFIFGIEGELLEHFFPEWDAFILSFILRRGFLCFELYREVQWSWHDGQCGLKRTLIGRKYGKTNERTEVIYKNENKMAPKPVTLDLR